MTGPGPDALQRKQLELAQLFMRLGELDTADADLQAERANVRAQVAHCRNALQALSPPATLPAPADVVTAKMRTVRK